MIINNQDPLDILPKEIILEIFSYLPKEKQINLVSKKWHDFIFNAKPEIHELMKKAKQEEVKKIITTHQKLASSFNYKILNHYYVRINFILALIAALIITIEYTGNDVSAGAIAAKIFICALLTIAFNLPGLIIGIPIACLLSYYPNPAGYFYTKKSDEIIAKLPKLSHEKDLEQGTIPRETTPLIPKPQ